MPLCLRYPHACPQTINAYQCMKMRNSDQERPQTVEMYYQVVPKLRDTKKLIIFQKKLKSIPIINVIAMIHKESTSKLIIHKYGHVVAVLL